MRLTVLLLPIVAATILSAGSLNAQYHEDNRVGFKVRLPKDWEQIPLQTNEGWIVGKYLSDENTFYTDPTLGYTVQHKPNLKFIAFVEGAAERDSEVEGQDEDSLVLFLKSPFKDYKEYMKSTYSGGGFYIADEIEDEVGDVQVTQIEIKVERQSNDGPKRIITWIYHLYRVDLAVQFEVLENHFDKQKRLIYRTLNSFKTVERSEGALTQAVTSGSVTVDVEKKDLTPEERAERRRGSEQRAHEEAMKGLPEDWVIEKMGRFMVLNHSDEKHAKRVVSQTEALWEWLDETFDYIGPDQYVRAPVIRICKDFEEERNFRTGTSWWVPGIEITTHKSMAGATSSEYTWLNQRMFNIWFQDRDRDLYFAFPQWLRNGMGQVVGAASPKGKKLEFEATTAEMHFLREMAREGTLMSVRDMLMADPGKMRTNAGVSQASALVRFLLDGPGSKSRRTKNLLRDYMLNLKEVSAEMRAAAEEKGEEEEDKPETEEEEEERFKAEQGKWKEREIELLKNTFYRTFADWRDKDWVAFEKAYLKYIS